MFSVSDYEREAARSAAEAKELRELCPEATVSGDRWFSDKLELAECNVAALEMDEELSGRALRILHGKKLSSGVVVWRPWHRRPVRLFHGEIMDPALVEALKSHRGHL